ncbi:MAG: NCS2 family permease [Armatimonadetes bacterium]|nr:NCS2 family permease [Armatimonadota bacterium]
MIARFFQLESRGTTVSTELRAGAVTFATMCYIVFVQPGVLSQNAGMDFGAVLVATCLSAALATLIMGLWANYPIAQAPLMGENFFFAISVVAIMKVPWETALGIVFVSGLLFLAMTVLRIREMILDAVPPFLKSSIAAGIGIFIAFIGLTEGGLVAKSPAPGAYVQIGDLASPVALLTLFGLALTAVLLARKVRGAILLGIAATAFLALLVGQIRLTGIVAPPPSLEPTFFKMDLAGALQHVDLILIFLFMLVFDTVGTLIGVSEQAGLTVDGKLPHADRAMLSDAVGTVAGAALGTSTVSSYIESAAGVADGARTGLANMMTAALFVLAIFFQPLVAAIGGGVKVGDLYYYPVTAPVIILVGSFMMAGVQKIEWDDVGEAIPAFLTMMLMPFTFNIAHGVAGGIVAYVIVKAGSGRAREISWLMWALAVVMILCYTFLPRLRH